MPELRSLGIVVRVIRRGLYTIAAAGLLWIIGSTWWSLRDAHQLSYPAEGIAYTVATDECGGIAKQADRIACFEPRAREVMAKAPFDTWSAFWVRRRFYVGLIFNVPLLLFSAFVTFGSVMVKATESSLRARFLRRAAEAVPTTRAPQLREARSIACRAA